MIGFLEVRTGNEKVKFMGTFEYDFIHGIMQEVKKKLQNLQRLLLSGW